MVVRSTPLAFLASGPYLAALASASASSLADGRAWMRWRREITSPSVVSSTMSHSSELRRAAVKLGGCSPAPVASGWPGLGLETSGGGLSLPLIGLAP
eukprot:16431647-Heterocapsa_arctica.AAC.1